MILNIKKESKILGLAEHSGGGSGATRQWGIWLSEHNSVSETLSTGRWAHKHTRIIESNKFSNSKPRLTGIERNRLQSGLRDWGKTPWRRKWAWRPSLRLKVQKRVRRDFMYILDFLELPSWGPIRIFLIKLLLSLHIYSFMHLASEARCVSIWLKCTMGTGLKRACFEVQRLFGVTL